MIFPFIFAFAIMTFISLEHKNKSITCLVVASVLMSILILCFFVGINSGTPDYMNYYRCFKNSPSLIENSFLNYSEETHTEMGFDVLQGFIRIFSKSATLFFGIVCFISLFFRYNFYSFFCEHKADICILFFAFFAHEFLRKDCIQIRNGIASSIILYSLKYLFNEKRGVFLIYVFFAASFQVTAIIAIPLLIVRKQLSRNYRFFLFSVFFLAILFSVFLPIKKIMEIMNDYGVLPSAIYNYLYWTEFSKPMSFSNPLLLKQVIITVFILFKNKKYFCDEKLFFYFQVYFVCTVYYLIFRDFEILAGRFGSLMYGVEPLLLLRCIYVDKKNILYKKVCLYLFYFLFFIMNVMTNNFLSWKPILD